MRKKKIERELQDNEKIEECAQKFGVTGDKTRLKICYLLCHYPELSVSQISELVESPISTISHSLKKLKEVGVVGTRRKSNFTNPMTQVKSSFKSIFSHSTYVVLFVILSFLSLVVFIFIPVKTIPGNSLELQLSIFTSRDYITMAVLSILTALFLTMQIFNLRNSLDAKTKLLSVGGGSLGGYTGVVGALFATASCASCLFAILGFLGFSTLIFLTDIRWYIVIGAIAVLLVSIYFLAKRINGICESCRIEHKKTR